MTAAAETHVTTPDGTTARCGTTDGELITWEQATDPAGPHFTCDACWLDAAAGREPMSGPTP